MELFAFDILNNLPKNIQSLFFNSRTEQIQDSAATIANISLAQQSEFFNEIVNVLIGKNNLATFEKNLTANLGLTQNIATTVVNFLNEKLFDAIKNDLVNAQSIYKQMSSDTVDSTYQPMAGEAITPTNLSVDQSPTEILSYIQELANALKQKDKKPETEILPENKKIASVVEAPITNVVPDNISEPLIKKENKQSPTTIIATEIKNFAPIVDEKKDSILLQAMRQNAIGEESKLSKYYKDLQNSLSEKTKETKNVFQPPFKSSANHGALIESFLDNTKINKDALPETNSLPVNGAPIKYSHWIKPEQIAQNADAQTSNDEKFVDLGDL